MKFLYCRHCKNIVTFLNSSGVTPFCCGEKMSLIEPNKVDASVEKHTPVVSVCKKVVTVVVGSILHPATSEHRIDWIMIETNLGRQRKLIPVGDAPKVKFALLEDEKVIAAYEYCNLHGLWMTSV